MVIGWGIQMEQLRIAICDDESEDLVYSLDLVKKYNSYNGKTPKFILIKGIIAEGEEK